MPVNYGNGGVFDYGNVLRNVNEMQNRNALTQSRIGSNELDNRYRQAQIDALDNPGASGYGDINWGQFTPESIQAHHAAGGGPQNANLLVRAYAPQIVDIGGVPHRVTRNDDGTPNVQKIPLSSLDAETSAASRLAGTKGYAGQAGQQAAQAGQGNPYAAVQPQELNLDVQQGQPTPQPVAPPSAAQLAGDKAEQVATAKETSEVKADLSRMKSNMPGLLKSVERLRGFSADATYTKIGGVVDDIVKESGMGATKGAVARASFIATIDNQILPLLRQTFGAAFTEAEGQTLKKSLADPDASHEERMAQLDAFILQKKENVLAKEAQLRSGKTDESYEQRRARILGQ